MIEYSASGAKDRGRDGGSNSMRSIGYWRGRVRPPEASPFLSAIEHELLKHQQVRLPRRKPEERQLTLL